MASIEQYFDPFYSPKPKLQEFVKAAPGHIADKVKTEDGDVVEPIIQQQREELPIRGQGTIAVRSEVQDLLRFSVASDLAGGPSLHLDVGPKNILLYYQSASGQGQEPIKFADIKAPAAGCLNVGAETTYWLSIDSNNGWLRYGKYFANKSMTLIQATLKYKDKEGVMVWAEPDKHKWLETVKDVSVAKDQNEILSTVIGPVPVVMDLPPFVVTADQITLRDIENGFFTAPVNLPDACQKLYGNVAGTKIVLNDDDFPQFAEAIQRSCTDPNGWAYKKLKSKEGELGSDPNGTYLRITLGYNQGDSPGIPYVLEIWPSQHFSPIHDHGKACAVIKVLYGEITCTWYESLQTAAEIGPAATLKQGQVTWISPNQYQIHKLKNISPTVCCTIQCYRYEDTDNVHYDGFDWRDDGTKAIAKFVPNSDATFTDFRQLIKDEWEALQKHETQNGTT